MDLNLAAEIMREICHHYNADLELIAECFGIEVA